MKKSSYTVLGLFCSCRQRKTPNEGDSMNACRRPLFQGAGYEPACAVCRLYVF